LPAADVKYVREKLVQDHSRANSCWWVSRGKAAHLFKACNAIGNLPSSISASETSRLLNEQLDHIGQRPTGVPPAVTSAVSAPAKIPYLLSLAPAPGSKLRCYHIPVADLNEGEMAEKLMEAFQLNTDAAVVFAEYFKLTLLALSDKEFRAYVPDNEL